MSYLNQPHPSIVLSSSCLSYFLSCIYPSISLASRCGCISSLNEHEPHRPLSLTYSILLPLCLTGTSVIQVTATDADDPTYGNSAKLVYTLVHGHEYFSVDPQTGGPPVPVPPSDMKNISVCVQQATANTTLDERRRGDFCSN